MATWHQQQRRTRLFHERLWNVVTDPPNECTTIMQFETEAEAKAFLERLRELDRAVHTYILPPAVR